jgi:hypothetical protein
MRAPFAKKPRQAHAQARDQGELEDMSIQVQTVIQIRWRRRDQDAEKDRPLIRHYSVGGSGHRRGKGVFAPQTLLSAD